MYALFNTGRLTTLRHNQPVENFAFGTVLFRLQPYAYRPEGFEDSWNFTGTQRAATYTNLSPGTYSFRVKASLTDAFKNAPQTVIQLNLLPPWHLTGWACALYALLVLGLLLGMRRLIRIRDRYKADLRIERLEAEKARALDRLRSGFFTNISHELRTPLTLILTPLEQLLRDPNAQGPLFQTMHCNASRLLRLTNQLLDLSKFESNTFQPSVCRQDVIGFVRQIADLFGSQAAQQRIAFQLTTEPDACQGWFDADMLEKVMYNLLANALKFTAEGGTIQVQCRVLDPQGTARLWLTVSDTGVGIPDEHQARIFERFYRVDGQTCTRQAGTGIGLALTRELVELHRGQIRVNSRPGIGSTFRVTLPIHRSAFPPDWLSSCPAVTPTPAHQQNDGPVSPADSPQAAPPEAGADAPLVLVVEDDADLRAYVAGCLGQHYRVLVATNGCQALALAQTEIPDLVVSDWMMPDMNGVELCRTLKTDERTSHVPLLLLTSCSGTDSQVTGLGAGADDYVTKPFNVDVLMGRVRNLIQSRQRLRAKYSRMVMLKPADIAGESKEDVFLSKLLALIETHLADPDFTVGRLERELGLSTTQLYRKTKALTGKGGNELIRSYRLQRAAQLLRAGDRQVAEVAYAVGFNDASYFIRAFGSEFGVSPGEWAKRENAVR